MENTKTDSTYLLPAIFTSALIGLVVALSLSDIIPNAYNSLRMLIFSGILILAGGAVFGFLSFIAAYLRNPAAALGFIFFAILGALSLYGLLSACGGIGCGGARLLSLVGLVSTALFLILQLIKWTRR